MADPTCWRHLGIRYKIIAVKATKERLELNRDVVVWLREAAPRLRDSQHFDGGFCYSCALLVLLSLTRRREVRGEI